VNSKGRIVRFIHGELLHDTPVTIDALAAGLLDSMMLEQLLAFIEDEFDIWFDDDELVPEAFADLETVVALVEAKRGTKA